MIQDQFIVGSANNDADNAVFAMRCRKCQAEFKVNFNLVQPVNCRHVLSESITVVCPKCKAEGTTTKTEHVNRSVPPVQEIKQAPMTFGNYTPSKELAAKINEYFANKKQRKIMLHGAKGPDRLIDATCSTCSLDFSIDVHKNLNCVKDKNAMLLRCPRCGTAETVNANDVIERLTELNELIKLINVEQEKLRKGA